MNYNTESAFALISGVISEDSEHNFVNVPIDDSYTLLCDSYEVSRNNKAVEIPTVCDGNFVCINQNAMTITTKGNVNIVDNIDFIDTFNEASKRAEPFNLTIGDITFSNMLLKSFSAKIDKYGINASCTLIFIEI